MPPFSLGISKLCLTPRMKCFDYIYSLGTGLAFPVKGQQCKAIAMVVAKDGLLVSKVLLKGGMITDINHDKTVVPFLTTDVLA
jgi:hypothetical protein